MEPTDPNPEPAGETTNSAEVSADNKIIFQSLKENRDTYFIEYTPARATDGLAILSLTFVDLPGDAEIVDFMEYECRDWLKRYPVPVHVMAFDDTDTAVRAHGDPARSYLLGLPTDDGLKLHWRGFKSPPLPIPPISQRQLLEIYDGIPFTTIVELKLETAEMSRSLRVGWLLALAWLAGVPLAIAVFGLASPLFGTLCALYSIYVGVEKLRKMLGYKEKSDREKEKNEKEARMQDYYYHCELNPEAFNRVKLENFQRSAREQTIKEKRELEQLADRATGDE